jgi:hypothetical protein
MTTTQARQPEGIPVGGQFAATAHSDEVPALEAKPARPAETLRRLRGHNFYPSAAVMAKWPPIYTNDEIDLPDQPIVAHYFQGGADWWVTEYDPRTNEVFGFAQLAGHGRGEWGYSSLTEIEQLRGQFGLPIERELDFTPGTLAKECIPQYIAEDRERKEAEQAQQLVDRAAKLETGWDLPDNETMDEVTEDRDLEYEWPDDTDPMSPDDRKLWDGFHRHAYNYAHEILGVTGFEDRDTIERFAVFAANAYQEADWNGMMDIHGVVDDWMAQERPLG